jgi:hypothetical protein
LGGLSLSPFGFGVFFWFHDDRHDDDELRERSILASPQHRRLGKRFLHWVALEFWLGKDTPLSLCFGVAWLLLGFGLYFE